MVLPPPGGYDGVDLDTIMKLVRQLDTVYRVGDDDGGDYILDSHVSSRTSRIRLYQRTQIKIRITLSCKISWGKLRSVDMPFMI